VTTSMHRREFLTLLGGSAAAWPHAARAQQDGRVRRIGYLSPMGELDPQARAYLAAFREGLAKLGWTEARNVRLDVRFARGDIDYVRGFAAELAKLAPEVIVTGAGAATRAMQQQTPTIPIVFVGTGDPAPMVSNIARPEGNTTGFSNFYASLGSKWLELLKEIAPRITRVALLFNPDFSGGQYFASIEQGAPTLGLKVIRSPFRDAPGLESAIGTFAAEPDGGLLVTGLTPIPAQREMLFRLATRHRLPAIYQSVVAVHDGGLIGYGPDQVDNYRRATIYVDRILHGAKVSELPVQFPTKFELVVNLKTAKAIGLTIPEAFLLRADEVIE
jgi:putative ABC transport system substrate-binding protein